MRGISHAHFGKPIAVTVKRNQAKYIHFLETGKK